MVKIEYMINKEEDIANWLNFINHPITYGRNRLDDYSKEFKDSVIGKTKEEQIKVINETIKPLYTKEYIDRFEIRFKNKIDKQKDEIIKRLEKIHSRKFPVEYIINKYTTFNCCPYQYKPDKDWFGIFFSKEVLEIEIELNVFVHELMHLFFHTYFDKTCMKKGLNKEQTQDLKEAVTIIINSEFKDIVEQEDKGYKIHRELRNQISKIWKKDKNFDNLINEMCEYILKHTTKHKNT